MAVTVAAAVGMTVVQSVPAFAADTSTYLVGLRANATRVDFPVGDRIDATVDVGTGNLSVLTSDLKLPGIAHDLTLGLAFNSLLVGASGSPAGVAGEWTDRVGYSTFINANADGSVAYYGPDGFQGTFTPKAGGGYTAPVGLKATLLGTASTGFSVRDHTSNETLAFASSGRLLTITDRNSQATTFTWTAGQLATITSTRSGLASRNLSRKAKFTYDANGRLKTITQDNDTSGSRAVTYSYTSGNLTGITDTAGRSTTFGYTLATGGDDLTSITNPGGQSTTLTYDGSHRVMSVLRTNAGGANAKTRFTYPSSTQTLVADPTTNGAGAVSSVPHTTYTLDSTERVASVTDALGRSRSATYTSFGDVATSSSSAVAGTQNTTTFGHTSSVNSGESLTSVGSATGGSSSLSYGGAGASQYLPSGGTDGQGNASTLSYDGAGNSLSGGNTALAATASVTYNGDGTLKSSTSPAGKITTYTEDSTTHQITGITPPSGSGLGATGLTYDGYGLLATVTDGRGAVTTYSYDDLDRVTSVAYSGGGSGLAGVTTVAYTYDPAGNLTKRVDGTGTTTTGYDGLNRLTSRTDGAGVVVGYGYDANGNLTSASNGFGTTTYTYDDANQLTSYTGPSSLPSYYFYDGAGKRTDTYWRAGPPATSAPYRPTAFTAHAHTDYDRTGRVAKTWTSKNSSDATTARVFDTGYCYSKYVPGVGCPNQATSAPSSTDTGLVQYTFDNRTLERTVYTYDGGNG